MNKYIPRRKSFSKKRVSSKSLRQGSIPCPLLFNMHDLLKLQPPRPESICTICYTSGTTGMPKGVMLTHENVVASMCSVTMQLGEHRPTKNDVMISFLPLAHMLERCCEVRLCGVLIRDLTLSIRNV